MSTNKSYLKVSYRWHRRIGICVAIPALVLALTGMLLNHSERLGFDRIFITNKSLLAWYGMVPANAAVTIQSSGHFITMLDDLLYFDSTRVGEISGSLAGAAALGDSWVIATSELILLIDAKSLQTIERIGLESLPPGKLHTIAVDGSQLQLDTSSGQYASDSGLTTFTPQSRKPLIAPQFVTAPAEIYDQILTDWRGRGLSLWRIILDLHSGVLFGSLGRLLADLAALAILLLVASGFYNWRKRPVR